MLGDMKSIDMGNLAKTVPGGIARLALDDNITIVQASESFYSLIKNVTDKAASGLPKSLVSVVYSLDVIYVTHQLAEQRDKKDNALISLNFRVLQNDGRFRWIMVSGVRTEEEYQSKNKTYPVYVCMAIDATEHMQRYKKFETDIEYQRTLLELSRELYFEYDIASDTLVFTELFREVFGRDSVIKDFGKKLEKSKYIHPDELPAVIQIYKSMMGGRKQVRFEVRLIPRGSRPVPYLCYASIIFDENKNPYKLIGKLVMSNPLKKETEPPAYVPELDSVTKLAVKNSAEKMIQEALSKQGQDSLSALMLLEVRNYKTANLLKKILNGEDIITSIASLLQSGFRSSDVIGRYGAGEFIVFMKDIYSDRNAYEMAEQICREVQKTYSFKYNRSGITVSIGIAFARGARNEYPFLLSNAKAALIMAKKEAASSFDVFVEGPDK